MKDNDNNEIQSLDDEFRAGLPERFANLNQAFSDLSASPEASTALHAIYHLIHNLAGSAGTFGYMELGRQAKILERSLSTYISGNHGLTGAELKSLADTLHALKLESEKGPDSPPLYQDRIDREHRCGASNEDGYLVYLVEDDQHTGQDLLTQLRNLGCRAELFADASSAAAAIDEQLPDAMLVDVMLPEGRLAGPELVDGLLDHHKGMPIIFYSARDDWEARLAAARAGGQAYLTKPLDYMKLLNAINSLVRHGEREPYRVLIIDDDAELAEHYARVLRMAGMQATALSSPNESLMIIAHFKPELILLDLYMPGITGIDVARVIRQHQDLLGIPIVFLSVDHDRDTQLNALREGDDFLQKPISDPHLVAAVTSKAERSRALSTLMHRDGLTGLLNHSTLKLNLEDELRRMRRLALPLSFVMLDLDHFKKINDQFGHTNGDEVLKAIAHLLSERLRKTDRIGRYGGEEFGILLPNTPLNTATRIVDELREHFAALRFTTNNVQFGCTFSAGVAQANNNDDVSSISERADALLYKAKRMGRNRVLSEDSDT